MRKIKLFLSLLMLIAFSVGNVWATDYQLVNSTDDLEANANYVIGNAASGSAKFMATTENSDNRKPTDEISITSGKITATNAVLVLKLEGSAEAWKFKTTNYDGTDGYLYNAESGTGNKCYVGATEREFTISFSGDAAVITATGGNARNILRWNTSGLFACYGSGQQPVYLFKEVSVPTVKYTVSFNTGAGNPTVSPIPETTAGQGITLPAGPTPACSADGWTFAGWAAAAVASETTTAPTLLAAGTNYKPTEDVTLFAVYKRKESGDAEWKFAQVTSLAQINAGGTFIITNGSKYLPSTTTTSSVAQADMVAITNGVVTGTVTDAMKWTFSAADGDGYVNLTNSDGKYLYATNSNSGLRVNTTEDSWKFEEYTVSDVLGFAMKEKTYSRYCAVYTDGSDWRPYTSKNATNYKTNSGRLDIYKYTEVTPSTTYYLSTPSCCTKHDISIASGIENGSVSADPAEACEGTTVTLTFTPATNYHLSAWTLNGVAQDVNANTFSMPAGAAAISATFEQDDCDPLATPVVTVSGKAYPYDAVQLAWTAIEHADAYKVYIYDNEDNELEHNDAFAGVEYTIGQTLSASTTYKYSVQAISNTPATYCPSLAATGSFVTEALPTAHLTLIALGEDQQASGDYSILTPFPLPGTAAACSKTFMGWDANSDCATAPTYAKGAEFTFQNTTGVTLYAVYADETPGEATLTKMTSADALADGDKVVIVANGTQYGVYQETQSSSYVKNWELAASTPAISELGAKKIWNVTADNTNWKFGDATNGYLYTSGSNNLAVSKDNATSWSVTWNDDQEGFILKSTGGRYFACRTDLSGDNANLFRMSGTSLGTNGVYGMDIYKYALGASTYDNYSTTCVAAPTAEPASASIAVAAAGGEGNLGVTYENVNLAGVTVALYNNEACTEAFDGGWLTASIAGDDKHIAYNAQANTSYNDARTAYIKLTAPETNSAANPAVVVIPVEQAKKPAVFASLAELVAASIATGTEVTVTFANEVITDDQYISQGTKRAGLMLTTKAANDKAIEIFYNKGTTVVPAEWLIGGKLAANAKTFTWTFFNDQWELVPLGNEWTWDNGDLTYTAPKAVSSVVVSGAPTKTSYVDGEKFAPAGLTVTINYSDYTSEVNPVGVTFACTPERVAKGATSVEVVATFNEIDSDPFEVTGLTVGDIQLKTIEEFIAAGNADMRCYLEGIVSDIETGTKLKYGNFNLTDASGTIYVYGCLNQAGEAEHFADLDVHNGDKIKVIAEDYDYFNSKHEAKNVQFVSKKPVATMTFDPMAMETDDVETMAPKTITEAEATAVVYSIKAGSDDCVSLDGAQITATAVGTATIVATLTETTEYVGTTVEFTVTVTAPDTRHIANASAFEAISGDMTPADIAFAAYKGDGTNAPVLRSSDNPVAIRLYKPTSGKSTGNYLTLTAKVGCTIDQVQITFSGNADAAYCKDDEALPTEKYITGETVLLTPANLGAQSVSIVNLKNGSIDVNAIKVWYNGEPLPIDHYFLGGSYPTEFEQYGAFDYTGLQVFAAYDAQETITEEIFDFTAEADLMTAGNKKAEVYRGEDKIAEYDITVTESPKQNPALAYTPSEETITLGDTWNAPVFSNPLNVEGITFSTSNNKVAKVTSDGVITLEGGCGTAVITASFEATEAYVASEATYTITVSEPAENLAGKWEIVKEVLPGMRIIIANEAAKTMGAQNSNNRAAVASTVDEDGVLTPANGTKTFLVVETTTEGQYALRALNGNYIYAASNSSNNLKEQATIDNNAKWSFNFAEGGAATIQANGTNSHNLVRYNSQSDIFSCYASGQSDVYVYAWKPYTRTVSGNYGTICLPNGGKMLNGALYEIAEMDYLNDKPNKIYFDEVEGGVMVAGKPYIFKPNDGETTLRVVYMDAENAPAGNYKGLYGKYTKTPLAKDDGNYILKNNQYYYVDSENVYCDANRAYIKLAEVPEYDSSKPSYSRRRIALNVNNEQVATGMENVQGDNVQCTKVLINGQLFIIRGEKMFDAKGQLVK